MDHRRGADISGSSPLKVAGIVLGLLFVIAIAFALGVKAGRELDFLSRHDDGETVVLKSKDDASGKAGGRSDAPAARHDEGAPHERSAGDEGKGTRAKGAGGVDAPPPATPSATKDAHPEPTSTASVSSAFNPSLFKGLPSDEAAAPGKSSAASPGVEHSGWETTKPTTTKGAKAEAGLDRSVAPPTAKDAKGKTKAELGDAKAAAANPQLTIVPEASATSTKPPEDEKSGKPGYTVQVAASKEKADADKIAARLKARGFSPYVVKVDLGSGTWYRVRVGRYSSIGDAKAAHKKVSAAGFQDAEVRSDR